MGDESNTWHKPYVYERPPFGSFGAVTHIGKDRLACHICGRDYKALGPHIWRAHGLLAAEYKLMFHIGSRVPLCGAATSKRYSEVNKQFAAASHLVPHDGSKASKREAALVASGISAQRRRAGLSPQGGYPRYTGLAAAAKDLIRAVDAGQSVGEHVERIRAILTTG